MRDVLPTMSTNCQGLCCHQDLYILRLFCAVHSPWSCEAGLGCFFFFNAAAAYAIASPEACFRAASVPIASALTTAPSFLVKKREPIIRSVISRMFLETAECVGNLRFEVKQNHTSEELPCHTKTFMKFASVFCCFRHTLNIAIANNVSYRIRRQFIQFLVSFCHIVNSSYDLIPIGGSSTHGLVHSAYLLRLIRRWNFSNSASNDSLISMKVSSATFANAISSYCLRINESTEAKKT